MDKEDYKSALAEAVLVLRHRAGLQSNHLALRANLRPEQITRIEKADRAVTWPVLLQVADALNFSLGQLFTFAEDQWRSREEEASDPDLYHAIGSQWSQQPSVVAQPRIAQQNIAKKDPTDSQGKDEE